MSITRYPVDPPTSIGAFNRQVFTGPTGTWTKPLGAQMVHVQLLAGGGGGGSGRRGPTGPTVGTVIGGGGGGAGGLYVDAWYRAADLPATVGVTVGRGGTGGSTVTTDDTNGNNGATGGASNFGTLLRAATQLSAGGGGVNSNPGSGIGGDTYYSNEQPGATGPNTGKLPAWGRGGMSSPQLTGSGGGANLNRAYGAIGLGFQPVGGGGGSSFSVTFPRAPGNGRNNAAMQDSNVALAGSTPGQNATPVATPKTLADLAYAIIPYYGGAGGFCGSPTGAATTGGNGSDGQGYGAGGGGGGAVQNGSGVGSGIGGRGADGLVIVTSYP